MIPSMPARSREHISFGWESKTSGGKATGLCMSSDSGACSDTRRVRGRRKQRGLLMTRQTNRWLGRRCIREISREGGKRWPRRRLIFHRDLASSLFPFPPRSLFSSNNPTKTSRSSEIRVFSLFRVGGTATCARIPRAGKTWLDRSGHRIV